MNYYSIKLLTLQLAMDDWQNHTRCFTKKTQYIFENNLFCDCEFMVGDEKIKCHKLVLAMVSPVFQAMFFGGHREASGPIEVIDIKPKTFLQIIKFIYEGKVEISSYESACNLYYGAKKYLLSFLERDCIEYIKHNLTVENVLYIFEFAKFHNEVDLEKQCLMEIQMNTADVLESKAFCNVSEDTLASILDMNLLNIPSELHLFKAVEKWTNSNTEELSYETKHQVASNLVKKLRLVTLTIQEFAEGLVNTDLLNDSEKLSILLRITKAVDAPMDNGFNELRNKRKQANFMCISTLDITELKPARCDGSEWLTSVFKSNSPIDLLGVEIRLQVLEEDEGNFEEYEENVIVKIGLKDSNEHFAEGTLSGMVQYNCKAQVMLNTIASLEPNIEYAIHVFLCRPGMYPIGTHSNLSCQNGSTIIKFVSHSAWERAHPYNTTVISSLIYADTVDEILLNKI